VDFITLGTIVPIMETGGVSMKSQSRIREPINLWMAVVIFVGMMSCPADAKKFQAPPMPVGYDDPEPIPENLLAVVVGGLKTTLKDPYSIRDFSLCQNRAFPPTPALAPTIPWSRAFRVTHFKLNAKNSYGGYTGLQAGIARFKEGKLERISLIGAPIQTGAPKEAREPCTPISDLKIQELLTSPR
jgi:hypothetical protein